MATSEAQMKPTPPPWFFRLGLHAPAVAGGKWLRRIRELLSGPNQGPVYQRLMAEYIGVHLITECRYENGELQMPYEVVRKLSVQEMRLIGLGQLAVEDSSIGEMFTSNAIPPSIQEATYKALIDGLTDMRQRAVEASWTKSPSSV